MRKNSVIINTLSLLLSTLFLNSTVFAGDIEWSGLYRIEGYQIRNSELRGSDQDGTPAHPGKKELAYGLSHLVLRPKINAGDGLTIYGQFDVFNQAKSPNNQMGQIWGNGVANTNSAESNTVSSTQSAEAISVSQLYLTLSQEFGQFIAGRVPLHFGLGMTHNAGRGLFDHFYDTRDLVGYKLIVGNLTFLPMIGKPSGGTINHSDNLDDYMIQVQYENPETDIEMGVFYQWRKGGPQSADAPVGVGSAPGQVLGGPGATNANTTPCTMPNGCSSAVNTKTVNVYVLKDTERFRLGMEASFMSGDSGVMYPTTGGGDKVTWGGFGIAAEFEYRPEASKWKWGLKAGSASGDDPNTPAKFEGYTFNRNYDIAMLMFNHPLGQADILRTGMVTGSVYDPGTSNINQADVEAISNAIYAAPVGKYAFSERWSLDNSLITGWLSTNPMPNQVSKSLGYEWDTSLNFTPRKGISWITQMGLLFPGAAWKGDGRYENGFAYGFETKAAISF